MEQDPRLCLNPAVSYLRAGLSGCGTRGTWAVERIRTHAHCDVVALHDPDPQALDRLGDAAGITRRATDFDAMLQTGVDFVILAGPCGIRRDQVERAADAGVPVLMHAPMAPDAPTAEAMVAACERGGVRLGVVVPQQADPVLEQIRQMIADDWLGGAVLVEGLIGEDRALREPPPPDHWLRDPARGGHGALLQLATPQVHLATWLTGRAAIAVTAQVSRGFSALPEDAAVGTAMLRGGALCTFAASHLTRGAAFAIYGTDGGVRLATDRIWLRGRREFSGAVFEYLEPGDEATLLRADIQEAIADLAPDAELHGRFARWLDDLDDFPCPGEQGALDMKLLDAWRRAAASGRTENV